MNQVFICGTYFHIYVSILKAIYWKEKNIKCLLIVNDQTPDIAKIFPGLAETGFFDFHLQIPFEEIMRKIKKDNNVFARTIKRNKFAIEYVEANSEILKYDEFIRNSEINLHFDSGLVPVYFLLKYKNNFIRMLEDGEGNYFPRVGNFKAFKRKYILNTVIGGGLDKEIKEIEVQFPENLIKKLKAKGKKFEFKKIQSELSAENKNKIIQLFMRGIDLNFMGDKKLLLITQPLEAKYMTEETKIELYNRLLDQYGKGYSIFLKPHPRELTDYNGQLNYEFSVIPRGFPLEMFDLLQGIKFELGVTVCSSSLYNMNCVEKKIILGREYLYNPSLPITAS